MCLRGFQAHPWEGRGVDSPVCPRVGGTGHSCSARPQEQVWAVGRRDLCWAFQETPTKELGHGGGAARSPERSSPTPAAGSPHLSRGLNSESSTDEEGTALGGRLRRQ